MSVHAIELALYDITTKTSVRKRFVAEPTEVLERYGLSRDEQEMIGGMNVSSMLDVGVSPMLTFGLWMCVRGPQELPEYLNAISGCLREAV
ncbi:MULTISPECIES: hypothetical protein [Erythrobacteraceae]|uniref:Extradiol ring-cleavage dioxygenase LigAB LigA subunit domain-containing protein n=2 Tax=Erythrobacteraceae TaxID=335929 RepID=A0A418NTR2_9SPHN|nr:hypothetical protein [Aurantiacibacter zhengii]RIV86882.1 hypothetical protein D2V07_09445 [Aurantiacibacter zhengii]